MTTFKTRDDHQVQVGDWISDSNGIYEVRDIRENLLYCREVIFEDDGSGLYHIDMQGAERKLTRLEVKHMEWA